MFNFSVAEGFTKRLDRFQDPSGLLRTSYYKEHINIFTALLHQQRTMNMPSGSR